MSVPNPEIFRWNYEWRIMLQEIYLARFLRFIPPIRDPGHAGPQPWGGNPNVTPMSSSTTTSQNMLLAELFIHALRDGDPNLQPNDFSIFNEVKKDNLHIEALDELIQQIDAGAEALKSELVILKKCNE